MTLELFTVAISWGYPWVTDRFRIDRKIVGVLSELATCFAYRCEFGEHADYYFSLLVYPIDGAIGRQFKTAKSKPDQSTSAARTNERGLGFQPEYGMNTG